MTHRATDVLIVGAGVAGLSAAGELAREGRAVQVLEARERVGGRILTVRQPGLELPVELGAEFVHGADSVTMKLAAEAGLVVAEVNGEHWRARDGRLERVRGFWEKVEKAMSRMDPERDPDRPVADALDEAAHDFSDDERRLLLEYVQGFHAADASRMGERALAIAEGVDEEEDDQSDRQLRILSGYDRIVAQLALAVPDRVRLGTTVTRISWKRGHAVVDARDAQGETHRFESRAVIITVPLGVLQSPPHATAAIAFDPDIPKVRESASRLAMGSVTRLAVRLCEPLWSTGKVRAPDGASLARLSFLHADAPIPVWWTPAPVVAPLLIGWCGGPAAAELSRLPAGELERLARDVLASTLRLSRSDLDRAIVSITWHDWQRDPFSRGAYAYVPVNALAAQRALTEPVGDTLWFAGEALSPGDPGTVHGAIESGRSAARSLSSRL